MVDIASKNRGYYGVASNILGLVATRSVETNTTYARPAASVGWLVAVTGASPCDQGGPYFEVFFNMYQVRSMIYLPKYLNNHKPHP